jgi:hypothetical protein
LFIGQRRPHIALRSTSSQGPHATWTERQRGRSEIRCAREQERERSERQRSRGHTAGTAALRTPPKQQVKQTARGGNRDVRAHFFPACGATSCLSQLGRVDPRKHAVAAVRGRGLGGDGGPKCTGGCAPPPPSLRTTGMGRRSGEARCARRFPQRSPGKGVG